MSVITERYSLYEGDCISTMRGFALDSFDTCVTDPPYGLGKQPDMIEVLRHWMNGDDYQATGGGFMGKTWDSFVPGPATWKEVYRVLKPGGLCLVFAGTRTYDLMGLSLRLAGFELRDTLMWLHGQGMPKGANISKHIDAHLGAEREVIGISPNSRFNDNKMYANGTGLRGHESYQGDPVTAPATDAAKLWEGWHTGLSPAWEPIIVAMKPLTSTFAANALAHGVAGLWVDGVRIETTGKDKEKHLAEWDRKQSEQKGATRFDGLGAIDLNGYAKEGRFPANLILDQSAAALLDEMSGETNSERPNRYKRIFPEQQHIYGKRNPGQEKPQYADEGGASRYFTVLPDSEPRMFYSAKASTSERNEGLDGLPVQEGDFTTCGLNAPEMRAQRGRAALETKARNTHPCTKPLSLMRWLVRLTKTPTGGVVLDPFGGSGTTGVACLLEGRKAVLLERESEYFEIMRHRMEHWQDEASTEPRKLKGKDSDLSGMPLFADIEG